VRTTPYPRDRVVTIQAEQAQAPAVLVVVALKPTDQLVAPAAQARPFRVPTSDMVNGKELRFTLATTDARPA
jgi:hypothetical protein